MSDQAAGAADAIRVSVDVALEPAQAFAALVEELRLALSRSGLELEPGQ